MIMENEGVYLTPENMRLICEKIEKLSIVVGHLAKDGRNEFSKYNYISNERMVTALRTNCLEYQISIIPSVVDYEEKESVNEKGKLAIRTIVTMNFKIVDIETGFFLTEQFMGAENDTSGKSFQQAITQCTKYFYFKLFNVTSSDEIDGDSKTDTFGAKAQPMTPQTPTIQKTWLTPDQLSKILVSHDPEKIENVLRKYNTDSFGMKKEFREQIQNHLNNLKQ